MIWPSPFGRHLGDILLRLNWEGQAYKEGGGGSYTGGAMGNMVTQERETLQGEGGIYR